MAPLETHRRFFAELITTVAGASGSRLTAAFAAVPREHYLGPGPWKVFTDTDTSKRHPTIPLFCIRT